MRKKLLIIATVLGLGTMLTVGVLLAFFMDKEGAYNVVTTGSINIKLNEEVLTPDAGEIWRATQKIEDGTIVGLEYINTFPGVTLEKRAKISNVGINPVHIREKITVAVTDRDGKKPSADGLGFWRSDHSGDQTKMFTWDNVEDADASTREESIIDGEIVVDYITIYGDEILESTEGVYPFSYVRVPVSQGNIYAGTNIETQLTVKAIQSDFTEVSEVVEYVPDRAWNALLDF